MPRARRQPERRWPDVPSPSSFDDAGSNEADPRKERTRIFSKTKMCKFFILNCCSRGDQCQFAHSKDQLAQLPDLFRTKLCRTLINTGVCNETDCRYAHSKDELRNVDGFPGTLASGKPQDGSRDAQHQTGADFWPLSPHQQQGQQLQQQQPQLHHPQQAPHTVSQQESYQPESFQQGVAANEAALQQMAALGQMAQAGLGTPGSFEQMMMLHMGQAAQAHVAEAVRLQAMAACLQAAGGFAPTASFMPTAPGGGSPTAAAAATAAALNGFRPMAGAQQHMGEQQMPQLAAAVQTAPGLQQQGGYPGPGTTGTTSGLHHQRRPSGASTASAGSRSGGAQGVGGHMRQGSGGGHTRQSSGGSARQGSEGGTFASSGGEAPGARLRNGKVVGTLADAPTTDLDTDEGGFAPSEPAQINFSSLRSLSSQSLSRLAEEAESVAGAETLSKDQVTKMRAMSDDGAARSDAENFGWRVKNTFLDFEAASTPLHGRLRTVCSAAGRLDALGEEPQEYDVGVGLAAAATAGAPCASKTPSPPASPWTGPQQPQQGRARSGSNPPALFLVPENTTKDFGGGQEATPRETKLAAAPCVEGGAGITVGPPITLELVTEKRSQDTPMSSRRDALMSPLGTAAGFIVKNTFLDFETEPVRNSLRSVHTAAGRLDLMGEE